MAQLTSKEKAVKNALILKLATRLDMLNSIHDTFSLRNYLNDTRAVLNHAQSILNDDPEVVILPARYPYANR